MMDDLVLDFFPPVFQNNTPTTYTKHRIVNKNSRFHINNVCTKKVGCHLGQIVILYSIKIIMIYQSSITHPIIEVVISFSRIIHILDGFVSINGEWLDQKYQLTSIK